VQADYEDGFGDRLTNVGIRIHKAISTFLILCPIGFNYLFLCCLVFPVELSFLVSRMAESAKPESHCVSQSKAIYA
jgi:hypothetical protein